MDENTVFVKRYTGSEDSLSAVDAGEVWRYAGFPGGPSGEDEPLEALFEEVLAQSRGVFRYDVCYRRFPLRFEDGMPVLPFAHSSKGLARCLRGSREAVMMAATVGIGTDRMIARAQRESAARALLWQALGAERVEALCDTFCADLLKESADPGIRETPRFSPGYGDLPLEKQKDFVRILDCSRQIGVSLSETLLMTPSKSVTAIFGILPACEDGETGEVADRGGQGCRGCAAKDCMFRKTPGRS